MPTGATDRAVLGIIRAHAFHGPTSFPSQALMARELGFARETVTRAVKRLAAAGHITIEKVRRPGSRWTHNVYTLRRWTRPFRAGLLRVLKAIRAPKTPDDFGPDHTKRTASVRTRRRGVRTTSSSLRSCSWTTSVCG
jgi:DNA-binding transcriptional MocR family regulator